MPLGILPYTYSMMLPSAAETAAQPNSQKEIEELGLSPSGYLHGNVQTKKETPQTSHSSRNIQNMGDQINMNNQPTWKPNTLP